MNTVLDSRGYGILLSQIGAKNQKQIKQSLTFTPQVSGDYGPKPKPIYMFKLGIHRLWVPKLYGINNYGPPDVINEREGDNIDLTFKGKLKEQQIEVVNQVIPLIKENTGRGGVLCLPTGYGKTVIAIYLACVLKKKVLWVTHQSNLLQQTKKSFEFFTGCEVGIIKQNKVDIDHPIVIGMLQSLSIKDYPPGTFDSFGFVIFDEVHRVPSKVFSQSIWKVTPTKYCIGLSATPERKDCMDEVVRDCIGPLLCRVEVQLKIPIVERIRALYDKTPVEKRNARDKPNIPGMLTDICSDQTRNEIIAQTVKRLYEEGRTILLLTDRRNHCVELSKRFPEEDRGLYLGQMKNKDLDESNEKRIIIGTYKMCAEGYDNPRLNTIILATSKRDIVQTVGRILGLRCSGNIQPKIIDICDTFSSFQGQTYARKRYYKQQGFEPAKPDFAYE